MNYELPDPNMNTEPLTVPGQNFSLSKLEPLQVSNTSTERLVDDDSEESDSNCSKSESADASNDNMLPPVNRKRAEALKTVASSYWMKRQVIQKLQLPRTTCSRYLRQGMPTHSLTAAKEWVRKQRSINLKKMGWKKNMVQRGKVWVHRSRVDEENTSRFRLRCLHCSRYFSSDKSFLLHKDTTMCGKYYLETEVKQLKSQLVDFQQKFAEVYKYMASIVQAVTDRNASDEQSHDELL
tara:strand:+ start:163 stop:876 length:714 start_codon:yes stop_codon:yes gene_type:complete